jgi:hypothetical protein
MLNSGLCSRRSRYASKPRPTGDNGLWPLPLLHDHGSLPEVQFSAGGGLNTSGRLICCLSLECSSWQTERPHRMSAKMGTLDFHVTSDGQSDTMSWLRAYFGTCNQILLLSEFWKLLAPTLNTNSVWTGNT